MIGNRDGKIVLYTTDDGKVAVSVLYDKEMFWMNQKAMGELFETSAANINVHIRNIFETEELDGATVKENLIVQNEGGRSVERKVMFYNLDMIIAIGYRVNSKAATRFRQWATQTLSEIIRKGFYINDDLMKNGRPFGKDYFDELLERIREIRASERRAYQKIADVFEQCSYDYDKNSQTTKDFYSFVQNKLHYAITGRTAAELISERVNPNHPTMGLTTWKGAPDGKIIRSDVTVAKNYLNEDEIKRLNRIVTMFIDHAELMAEDRVLMSMQDWLDETDKFLKINRRNVLLGKGAVSHERAAQKAEKAYDEFRVRQDRDYVSNFDKEMERYLKGKEDE